MAPIAPEQIVSRAPVAATGRRNVSIGGGSISGGTVSNAARVLAGLRPSLRSCYERETSSGTGSIRFTLAVGPSGEVMSVSPMVGGSLSSQLTACASSRLKATKFAAPEGGSATIQFPATFAIEGVALDVRAPKKEAKPQASGL
jgi:hypothetical protein